MLANTYTISHAIWFTAGLAFAHFVADITDTRSRIVARSIYTVAARNFVFVTCRRVVGTALVNHRTRLGAIYTYTTPFNSHGYFSDGQHNYK